MSRSSRPSLGALVVAAAGLALVGCGGSDAKTVASSNAQLSSLAPSAGTLNPLFDANKTQYTLIAPRDAAHVTLTPTAAESHAKITVSQNAATPVSVPSGSPCADLTLPEPGATASIVRIAVTAEDGKTTTTYNVALSQAKSTDAALSGAVLSAGTLYPAFSPDVTQYRVAIPNTAGVTSLTLTPTAASIRAKSITVAQDSGAAVTVASGSASGALAVPAAGSSSDIRVTVTAEDDSSRDYHFAVQQTAATDAALASLTVSDDSTITPAFAPAVTTYDVIVPNGTSTVTVTPTASSPAVASMTLTQDGSTPVVLQSGETSAPLQVPAAGSDPSVVVIEVTAEDGVTKVVYTLYVGERPSSDPSLASLGVSAGALAPTFTSATHDYSLVLPNGTTSVTVTPTSTDEVKSIAVSQDGGAATLVESGSASGALTVPAPGAASIITLLVTAQDGTTTVKYTISVVQAAANTTQMVWFHEDFEDGTGWITRWDSLAPATANVSIQIDPYDPNNHVLQYVASGDYGKVVALIKDSVWAAIPNKSNYYIEARISPYSNGTPSSPAGGTTGQKQLFMIGRYQDADNFYAGGMNLQITSPRRAEARVFVAGASTNPVNVQRDDLIKGFFDGTGPNATPNTSGRWYRMRLDMVDGHMTLYLDGQVIGSFDNAALTTGKIGLYTHNPPFLVDDIRVGDPSVKPVALSIDPLELTWTAAAAGQPRRVTVTAVQADGVSPDAFAVTTSDPNIVGVSRNGSVVTIQPKAEGTASVRFMSGSDPTLWKIMTVTVTPPDPAESRLATLEPSVGAFDVPFAPDTLAYKLIVPAGNDTVTLTPTAASTRAQSITVTQGNGSPVTVTSGAASPALTVPILGVKSNVTIVVKAENGVATTTYTVELSRAPSSDATLSALAVSAGNLEPAFASATETYDVQVPMNVTSITVTPTVSQAGATISVAQDNTTIGAVASGTASPSMSLPEVGTHTSIVVTVKAEDALTVKQYTLSVVRVPVRITSLVPSAGVLTPAFDPDVQDYEVLLANGVTSVALTAGFLATEVSSMTIAQDAEPAVTLGNGVASAVFTVPAPGSATVLTIVVTAAGSSAQGIYKVTARQLLADDATLGLLTVSAGTLTPAFARGTNHYDVVLPNGTTTFTVTPTAASTAAASITVAQDAGTPQAVASGTASQALTAPAYGAAASVITIVVTAQNATTQGTYTVSITQAPSSDATLNGLVLSSGKLAPSFASATWHYAASILTADATFTVTPSATGAGKTITVSQDGSTPTPVTTDTASGALTVPAAGTLSEIAVTVHAQDAVTSRTYTVTVTRALRGVVWFSDDFADYSKWTLTPKGFSTIGAFLNDPATIADPLDGTNNVAAYFAGTVAAGQTGVAGGVIMTVTDTAWAPVENKTDYYLEYRVAPYSNSTTSSKQLYAFGRYVDDNNFAFAGLNLQTSTPTTSSRLEAGQRVNGAFVTSASTAGGLPGMVKYNIPLPQLTQGTFTGTTPNADCAWHTLRFEYVGTSVRAYLDGADLVSRTNGYSATGLMNMTGPGKIGFYVNNKSFLLDDVKVGRVLPTLTLAPADPAWTAAAGSTPYAVTVTATQPDNTTADAFAVNSSNPAVVSVSRIGNVVNLTALAAGSATITFVSGSQSSVTATITATITP